jgi:hypothetical protein
LRTPLAGVIERAAGADTGRSSLSSRQQFEARVGARVGPEPWRTLALPACLIRLGARNTRNRLKPHETVTGILRNGPPRIGYFLLD